MNKSNPIKVFQALLAAKTNKFCLAFRISSIQNLPYSEVPNRRADQNKRAGLEKSATLLAYLVSKLINEQGGIFRLLHEKLRAGRKENLKNLSKRALQSTQK